MSQALDWSERRVRHLALETPREFIPRVSFVVEDALRTATLPGVERGLTVVRAIDLGEIRPNEPPIALSRRIEKRWRDVLLHTVDAGAPEAPHAVAVRFESEPAMLALYIRRRLQGPAPVEWFWRKAVPASIARTEEPELLPLSLLHFLDSADRDLALGSVVELLARLEGFRVLAQLTASIDDVHARALLYRWTPRVLAEWEEAQRHVPLTVPEALDQSVAVAVLAATAPLVALSLRELTARMIQLALAGRSPASMQDPERVMSGQVQREAASKAHSSPRTAPPPDNLTPPAISTQAAEADLLLREPEQAPALAAEAAPVSRQTIQVDSAVPPSAADSPLLPLPDQFLQQPFVTATRHGGLLFALAVLNRIGWRELDTPRQEDLLPYVLVQIARSAGTPADDVLLNAVAPYPIDIGANEHAARIWHRGTRRWTRTHARMLLNFIIRRTAAVSVTRTHIDVYFSLDQADLRIRRAGLDQNPGWVPALGRVVSFHYDAVQN